MDPANSNVKVPANTFYLDLELTEIDDLKYKTCHIESYKEIFQKAFYDGPHRIALYAPAGCGKTCLCHMMSFCWAKYNTLGNQFELVLFMRLRGHSLQDDVAKIIVEEALPHKPGARCTVADLIQKHRGKILFVLDGYDELFPVKASVERDVYTLHNLLNDSAQHIIISTRPSQLGELKKSVNINMKVRIKGLSEEQARQFILNYCKLRDIVCDSMKSMDDVIMDQLRENNLVSLSRNPQQLQLVCDFQRDCKQISTCLTDLYDNFYLSNCNQFLKKVREDDRCSEEVKREILSKCKHEELLKDLEKLALNGFVRGRLLYDEQTYLRLLGEFFVTVFDKLGVVYFEETVGANIRVLGFRHKSFQEFFSARILYRNLIMKIDEMDDDILEAIEQWQDIRKAIRFERIFVFMAGMAKTEDEAKRIIYYITEIILKLPEYFASEESIDLHDLEDLPRQIILMQIKCVLEIKASGKCKESQYIAQLLAALPYSEELPPLDVNEKQG